MLQIMLKLYSYKSVPLDRIYICLEFPQQPVVLSKWQKSAERCTFLDLINGGRESKESSNNSLSCRCQEIQPLLFYQTVSLVSMTNDLL